MGLEVGVVIVGLGVVMAVLALLLGVGRRGRRKSRSSSLCGGSIGGCGAVYRNRSLRALCVEPCCADAISYFGVFRGTHRLHQLKKKMIFCTEKS